MDMDKELYKAKADETSKRYLSLPKTADIRTIS
jgi:hypothetical protein